ncbi:MAG: hypothetical protein ACMZ63_10175 [Methylotenera sp.]
MKLFLPVQRAALLIPTGDDDKKHLFVLLTNPTKYPTAQDQELTLLVNISSVRKFKPHDNTCLLYPGDHPFIRHDSYVNYHFARIEETRKLINGCKKGLFINSDPFDSDICARICNGLLNSRHTTLKIKKFYSFCSNAT